LFIDLSIYGELYRCVVVLAIPAAVFASSYVKEKERKRKPYKHGGSDAFEVRTYASLADITDMNRQGSAHQ
jgi:hypothetical protein